MMRLPCFALVCVLTTSGVGCTSTLPVVHGCDTDVDCRAQERCALDTRTCVEVFDGAPDAGASPNTADAGIDAGVVGDPCLASVRITNRGDAEGALPVRVDLPPLGGPRSDGTNLRVTLPDGSPLPFAPERAEAGLSLFVRLPGYPRGTTEILVSTCEDTDGAPDARATFDYLAVLDAPELAEWTGATCDALNSAGELCSVDDPRLTTWTTTSASSCSLAPFDGLRTRNSRELRLPAGRYAVDVATGVDAEHFSFCRDDNGVPASTGASARLELVGAATIKLKEVTCAMSDCARCTTPLARETFEVVLDGGAAALSLATEAGDCARVTMTTSDLRMRRLPASTPLVEVVVDGAP